MDDQLGTHDDAVGDRRPPNPPPGPPSRGLACKLEYERLAKVGLKSPPEKNEELELVADEAPAATLGRRLRGREAADSASGGSTPEDENIGKTRQCLGRQGSHSQKPRCQR